MPPDQLEKVMQIILQNSHEIEVEIKETRQRLEELEKKTKKIKRVVWDYLGPKYRPIES